MELSKELGIYNNKRETLTIEQQADFLELVEHSQELSWYYNLFVFFFETGCRCGESIGLTWSNVDFHNLFIKIDHQLIYELDENDERRFQVTDTKTIKRIRKVPLSVRVLQALKMQKMKDIKPELLLNISAHILSHTVCTCMADEGMDQRTLQEIMGHQNLALTMKVCNHVDEKRMRDGMDKLDAVQNVSKAIGTDNNGKAVKVS